MMSGWFTIDNAVSDDKIAKILSLADGVLHEGGTGRGIDHVTRKSKITFVNEFWLFEEIWPHLNAANSTFNLDIDGAETIQITKYETGDHYDFHQDGSGFNLNSNGVTRKLSMTLGLNEEYEGGEFSFFDGVSANPFRVPKGTMIFFPSWEWHKVFPVTSGTRYSMVCWFTGKAIR